MRDPSDSTTRLSLPWHPSPGCPVRPVRRCARAIARLVAAFALVAIPSAAPAAVDDPVPPHVEAAVDKALEFLARTQKPDGTWPHGGGSTTAVPSLSVMAFLARGHVPGQGPYGDLLYRSIDHVLAQQKPETGILSGTSNNAMMYEHGISTAMLCEVYGMVDDERRSRIGKALEKAIRLTLSAQKLPDGRAKSHPHTGGWRYQPGSGDADISVTGWQLMALRGAANCGAAVPKEALDEGVAYVRRNAVPKESGGGFAYQPGGNANPARTGTGILALELLGQHHSPEALAGAEFLTKNPPDNPGQEFYFYSVYYCAQALNQLGDPHWDAVYPKLRDALLKLQQADGRFTGGGGQEAEAGDAYRTSMSVLALCVPYRYLPLYQK